jgi:hypothetical protein
VTEHESRQRSEDDVVDLAASVIVNRDPVDVGAISKVHIPPKAVSPTIFVTSRDGGELSTTSVFTSAPDHHSRYALGSAINFQTSSGRRLNSALRDAACLTGRKNPTSATMPTIAINETTT